MRKVKEKHKGNAYPRFVHAVSGATPELFVTVFTCCAGMSGMLHSTCLFTVFVVDVVLAAVAVFVVVFIVLREVLKQVRKAIDGGLDFVVAI